VLNIDAAGQVASAPAMGIVIFYTNVGARLALTAATRGVLSSTQAWRTK
jgi:iron(III) transport system permease protein